MEEKLSLQSDSPSFGRPTLWFLLAGVLVVMAIAGMLLKARVAVAALSWGWEDIISPVTSEPSTDSR